MACALGKIMNYFSDSQNNFSVVLFQKKKEDLFKISTGISYSSYKHQSVNTN